LTYLDSQKIFVFFFDFFTELGLDGLGFALVVHTNRPILLEQSLVIGQFENLPKRS
jgi:hypothetical protein